MSKMRKALLHPGFRFLLLMWSLLVLAWPLLSHPESWSVEGLFLYQFMAWALVIFFLYLISRPGTTSDP